MFRLYLITDPAIPDLFVTLRRALSVLPLGAAAVQLRDGAATGRSLYEQGCKLREITRRYGAALFINDRADVARAVGADGVHLRANSYGPSEARRCGLSLGGRSTHSPNEVSSDCDFVVFGPVFDTPGKGPPLGLESLRQACARGVPVFALGGVTPERVRVCREAGAAGVACSRAVLGSTDPATQALAMWKAFAVS